jgi:hypothetical protein
MPTEPRNRIDPKLILLFVVAAYVTYLFHEFGHWSITVAAIVLALLVLIVVRASSRLNLSARTNGYLVALATACQLLVIGTYELFS